MLLYEPSSRISAKQGLKHPYFANVSVYRPPRLQDLTNTAGSTSGATAAAAAK